jgi:D-serine deaminase-like pyridoxal phosphate-dependent protein
MITSEPDKQAIYKRYSHAIEGLRLPLAIVDMDNFDWNMQWMLDEARQAGKKIRLASKSLRCIELMKRVRDAAGDQFAGLMIFSPYEAEFLAKRGFNHLLLAYPVSRPDEFETIARVTAGGTDLQAMVDSREHIEGLAKAAKKLNTVVSVMIDIDMSLRPRYLRSMHIGVRRSPLRDHNDAMELARIASNESSLRFAGIMGYEAQVAGLADENPFSKKMNAVRKIIRKASVKDVRTRRIEIVKNLADKGFSCDIVNGGGSGSIRSSIKDTSLTEVTIGSGLLAGHLFSYFSDVEFRPAFLFALSTTRIPSKGFATCFGGGYIASGSTDPDRQPVPYLPDGLNLLKMEGAGEVQTPLAINPGVDLKISNPVFFRPAKSGEPAERFKEFLLISSHSDPKRVLTYRGDGECFG